MDTIIIMITTGIIARGILPKQSRFETLLLSRLSRLETLTRTTSTTIFTNIYTGTFTTTTIAPTAKTAPAE